MITKLEPKALALTGGKAAREAVSPTAEYIGQQVYQTRQSGNWSRGDVGTAAGLSIQQVAAVEQGTVPVSVERLLTLAAVMGVHVGSLMPESLLLEPATSNGSGKGKADVEEEIPF
jgi:transcriptional regulator with XRE-family HTH domain